MHENDAYMCQKKSDCKSVPKAREKWVNSPCIVFFLPSRCSSKTEEAPSAQRMSLAKKQKVNLKTKDNFTFVYIVKIDNIIYIGIMIIILDRTESTFIYLRVGLYEGIMSLKSVLNNK